MIDRLIEPSITKLLNLDKGIVIYGARQVGKTTLVKKLSTLYDNVLFLNCDDPATAESLSNVSLSSLTVMTRGYDCLVIDEAQKVVNIGNAGKMIVDNMLVKQLFMTGSSSLDLANNVKEPMTGRVFEFMLYPLSYFEVKHSHKGAFNLDTLLIHGGYPEVVTSKNEVAERIITQILSQYTFRDVLGIESSHDPGLVRRLLISLALQVGGEVSYNELSNLLEISRQTLEKYIWLLEQSYIIFRLDALTGNPRRLVSSRKRKIYFYDLGLRNALIGNFNSIDIRNDVGALFENFCVVERRKLYANIDKSVNFHYFRSSRTPGEIDLIEDSGGETKAYEFKWRKPSFNTPSEFTDKYPNVSVEIITKANLDDFLRP